jgi:hypothetical protein
MLLNVALIVFVCAFKNTKQVFEKFGNCFKFLLIVFTLVIWLILGIIMNANEKIDFLYWQF